MHVSSITPGRRRPPLAAVLALLVALTALAMLAGGAWPAPARAATHCPDARQVSPGLAVQLCSQSSYVDDVGVTHLLLVVTNPGPLVESLAADVTAQTSGGPMQLRVYGPVLLLATGDTAPLEGFVPAGVTVTSFAVTGFESVAPTDAPNHNFALSNVAVDTSATGGQIVSGTVTNNTGAEVEGIRVAYFCYDNAGRVAWLGQFVVSGNNRRVPAGASFGFSIPNRNVPSYAVPADYTIVAEGSGLAAPIASPTPNAAASSFAPVARTRTSLGPISSFGPVANLAPAGVPSPNASAVAGAANPGRVTPSHDAHPGRRTPTGVLPSLIQPVDASANEPTTTSTYAPILVVGLIGLAAFVLLGRQLAAFRAGLAERRLARAEARARGELADPDYVPPTAPR